MSLTKLSIIFSILAILIFIGVGFVAERDKAFKRELAPFMLECLKTKTEDDCWAIYKWQKAAK